MRFSSATYISHRVLRATCVLFAGLEIPILTSHPRATNTERTYHSLIANSWELEAVFPKE